jgi:hypothetical protein
MVEPIRRTCRKSSSYSSGRNLTMTLTVRPALSSVSVIQYPMHIAKAALVATPANIQADLGAIQSGVRRPEAAVSISLQFGPIMKTSGLSTGRNRSVSWSPASRGAPNDRAGSVDAVMVTKVGPPPAIAMDDLRGRLRPPRAEALLVRERRAVGMERLAACRTGG